MASRHQNWLKHRWIGNSEKIMTSLPLSLSIFVYRSFLWPFCNWGRGQLVSFHLFPRPSQFFYRVRSQSLYNTDEQFKIPALLPVSQTKLYLMLTVTKRKITIIVFSLLCSIDFESLDNEYRLETLCFISTSLLLLKLFTYYIVVWSNEWLHRLLNIQRFFWLSRY